MAKEQQSSYVQSSSDYEQLLNNLLGKDGKIEYVAYAKDGVHSVPIPRDERKDAAIKAAQKEELEALLGSKPNDEVPYKEPEKSQDDNSANDAKLSKIIVCIIAVAALAFIVAMAIFSKSARAVILFPFVLILGFILRFFGDFIFWGSIILACAIPSWIFERINFAPNGTKMKVMYWFSYVSIAAFLVFIVLVVWMKFIKVCLGR